MHWLALLKWAASSAGLTLGDRLLKVNHAGEHGAVNIYRGQILLARLTARSMVPELLEFKLHEERHRALFEAELRRRGVRRCRGYGGCGLGGFVLGVCTGLFGRGAIAATTVAVERVVLAHLAEQLIALEGKDVPATATIRAIVAEEQEHHDRSARHAAGGRFWLAVLAPVVAGATRAVIWVGVHAG